MTEPRMGQTPQGQVRLETPKYRLNQLADSTGVYPGWWRSAGAYGLTSPLSRYGGQLRSARQVPMNVRLEMLGDPVIQLALAFASANLVDSVYTIRCADPAKQRFFEAMYAGLHRPFMAQAAMAIALGSLGLIKRFAFEVPAAPDPEDTDPTWTGAATPYIVAKFEPLYPDGTRPEFDDDGRTFAGITTPDGESVDVEFALWLTRGRALAFGSYYGFGRVQVGYPDWWLKQFGRDLQVVHWQKNLDPVVAVRHPEGEVVDESGTVLATYQSVAQDVGDAIRGGATVTMPSTPYSVPDPATGEKKFTGVPMWDLEFKGGVEHVEAFHQIEDHRDARLALAMLLPSQAFMQVQQSSLGGPTTADVLTDLAEKLLLMDAAEVDDHLNSYVFPQVARANFPPESPPVAKVTERLGTENRKLMEQIVTTLAGVLDSPVQRLFDVPAAMERVGLPVVEQPEGPEEPPETPEESPETPEAPPAPPQRAAQGGARRGSLKAPGGLQASGAVLWEDPDGDFEITEGDVDAANREWDARMGRAWAGLLDATPVEGEVEAQSAGGRRGLGLQAGPLGWVWDVESKRYRSTVTGRFVSREEVVNLVMESTGHGAAAARTVSELAARGHLAPDAWYGRMRDEIRREIIRQYELGRGGRQMMTYADWGRVGAMSKEQYGHLRDFLKEVEAGTLSEAQLAARAEMYVRSATEAYSRAAAVTVGLDPKRLPAHPGDGSTACLSNCQCVWVIEEVRGEGGELLGWNCTWTLGAADHCGTCLARAREWAPLFIPV